MFGRHFESMYRGSMVGAGAPFFAVWGYVIATMRPDKEVGAQVELNPKLLSAIIGEDQKVIEGVIERMCGPDPESRTKKEDGKRLVRLGQFDYRVVNGAKYMAIRNEEERRESNRRRQEKARAKAGKPLPFEQEAVKAFENGDDATVDRLAAQRKDGE